jgi:hypothetical protein
MPSPLVAGARVAEANWAWATPDEKASVALRVAAGSKPARESLVIRIRRMLRSPFVSLKSGEILEL